MINGNELGNVGFKYLGVPYSQMDCQAFVEKCLSDCGLKMNLAGSNAWYREVMAHGVIMTPEECVKQLGTVPDGAFLFIHAYDGGEPAKYRGDGLGNASHIGLCTGKRGEGAIASSKSRGCVAESKFRNKSISGGWNAVGLYDKVEYDYSGSGTGGGGSGQPDPEPEPTEEMTAVVGNVPAGNRQDVNLRTKASTTGKLIDRVPCGEIVEILDYGDTWCKVRWEKQTGYMMTKYLLFDYDGFEETYTVIIPGITREEAENFKTIYPDAEIRKEG